MATQQQLSDAWSSQQNWCTGVAGSLNSQSLTSQNIATSDIGACSSLDAMGSSSYFDYTGSPSGPNLNLTNLSVQCNTTVIVTPPTFTTLGSTPIALLAVNFDSLTINGLYLYSEYCQCYSEYGKTIGGPMQVTEPQSNFTVAYTNNWIVFTCEYSSTVSITGVSVSSSASSLGTPSPGITVNVQSQPWYESIFNIFSSSDLQSGIQGALANSNIGNIVVNQLQTNLNNVINGNSNSERILVKSSVDSQAFAGKYEIGISGLISVDNFIALTVLSDGSVSGSDIRGFDFTGTCSAASNDKLQFVVSVTKANTPMPEADLAELKKQTFQFEAHAGKDAGTDFTITGDLYINSKLNLQMKKVG